MTRNALIVFESMFGNTEDLATAVAEGLTFKGVATKVVQVGDCSPDDLRGLDLLVVAAPTHTFSLSRPQTRADAVTKGAEPRRAALGVREWIGEAVDHTTSMPLPRLAVFDTKVEKVRRLPGSAARLAARLLRQQGFVLLDPPRSFYVEDVRGPVCEGERDRARLWGERLCELVAEAEAPASP